MTDPLAALLHGWTCGTLRTDEWDMCLRDHRREAKWLRAAGVTLAPSDPGAPLRYIGGVLHQPECNGVVCPERVVGECVTEAATLAPKEADRE